MARGMVVSLVVLVGCSGAEPGDDPPAVQGWSLELAREAAEGPDRVGIRLRHAEAPDDVTLGGEAQGDALSFEAQGDGLFEAWVDPEGDAVELPVVVEVPGRTFERVALVLPNVGERWGQPEAVPGLVNTPGYEDSTEVSPDGQWLIVSNYSPVDLIGCIVSAGGGVPSPTEPLCNVSLGPIGAPERPDLPGADRILSATEIDHRIPELGLVGEGGGPFPAALPPVAGYGFKAQPDGTFAEPFVIAYDAGGFMGAPFGLTFLANPNGAEAAVAYGWNDPSTPAEAADLYVAGLTLGQNNDLGKITLKDSQYVVTPPTTLIAQGQQDDIQSNPFVDEAGVYYDQHDSGPERFDILFAAGTLDAPLADPVVVGLSQDERSEYQPFLHGDDLYFAAGEFEAIHSSPRVGDDPASVASWGPERVEIGLEPGAGPIVSVGEPSVAVVDGREWLYFIYGQAGDVNVGRVAAVD